MVKPVLSKETAYNKLQDFFSNKPFVLFGTGTSCAIDPDFGMKALHDRLSAAIPILTKDPVVLSEWSDVEKNFSKTNDFEGAMNAIKQKSLLELVTQETFKHVGAVDRRTCRKLFGKHISWPAILLIKRLVDKLPQDNPVLHVATPNYDMVAEYAFALEHIPYITGFWGGVVKKLDWVQSHRAMAYSEKTIVRKRQRETKHIKNHIRLYKVHGSLNTFIMNNEVIESDIWRDKTPSFVSPMLITPGLSKYQRLHDYRKILLEEFDKEVSKHCSFLFLGFGFNDSQIVNNEILPKLKSQSVPALIITRDLNRNIEKILSESKDAWIVCKHEDRKNNSTRIYNSKFQDWLYLDNKQLWNFDVFTNEILGG